MSRMSISQSSHDKTYDTAVSNPEPEPVFISKEGKSNYIKALICISVDCVVTIFLILVQYGLFGIFEDKIKTTYIVIIGIIAFVFFVFIIIFIVSHITILVTISKYSYIIVGGIYYGYKVILMIMYLTQTEEGISNSALVFFIIILATIIPRVFGFYNLEALVKVCQKVDENKRILAHEKFIEKIGNNVDVGASRWSNNFDIERMSNARQGSSEDKN